MKLLRRNYVKLSLLAITSSKENKFASDMGWDGFDIHTKSYEQLKAERAHIVCYPVLNADNFHNLVR